MGLWVGCDRTHEFPLVLDQFLLKARFSLAIWTNSRSKHDSHRVSGSTDSTGMRRSRSRPPRHASLYSSQLRACVRPETITLSRFKVLFFCVGRWYYFPVNHFCCYSWKPTASANCFTFHWCLALRFLVDDQSHSANDRSPPPLFLLQRNPLNSWRTRSNMRWTRRSVPSCIVLMSFVFTLVLGRGGQYPRVFLDVCRFFLIVRYQHGTCVYSRNILAGNWWPRVVFLLSLRG